MKDTRLPHSAVSSVMGLPLPSRILGTGIAGFRRLCTVRNVIRSICLRRRNKIKIRSISSIIMILQSTSLKANKQDNKSKLINLS